MVKLMTGIGGLGSPTRGVLYPEYDNQLIETVDDNCPSEWKLTDTRAKQVLQVSRQFAEIYEPNQRIPKNVFNDITLDVAKRANCTQSNINTLAARIYGADDDCRPEDGRPYVERFREDLIVVSEEYAQK